MGKASKTASATILSEQHRSSGKTVLSWPHFLSVRSSRTPLPPRKKPTALRVFNNMKGHGGHRGLDFQSRWEPLSEWGPWEWEVLFLWTLEAWGAWVARAFWKSSSSVSFHVLLSPSIRRKLGCLLSTLLPFVLLSVWSRVLHLGTAFPFKPPAALSYSVYFPFPQQLKLAE